MPGKILQKEKKRMGVGVGGGGGGKKCEGTLSEGERKRSSVAYRGQ